MLGNLRTEDRAVNKIEITCAFVEKDTRETTCFTRKTCASIFESYLSVYEPSKLKVLKAGVYTKKLGSKVDDRGVKTRHWFDYID